MTVKELRERLDFVPDHYTVKIVGWVPDLSDEKGATPQWAIGPRHVSQVVVREKSEKVLMAYEGN